MVKTYTEEELRLKPGDRISYNLHFAYMALANPKKKYAIMCGTKDGVERAKAEIKWALGDELPNNLEIKLVGGKT